MAEFLLFSFELGTLINGYLFFKFVYGLYDLQMIFDYSINWVAFFEWLIRGFIFGVGFMLALIIFIKVTKADKK